MLRSGSTVSNARLSDRISSGVSADVTDQLTGVVLGATGAAIAARSDVVQSLWSGYGEIVRYQLSGSERQSVIVKHVMFPSAVNHPRGWHNDRSHRRKVRSYEVEMRWYRDYADQCDAECRVPEALACGSLGEEQLIILEDLDAAGFPERRSAVDLDAIRNCLRWLAAFHARFLGVEPDGLWPVGCYWHLATRPDELAAIEDPALQEAAPVLDSMLNQARFRTFVHGDAKLANFCFAPDGRVAAVDFQYVGGGCGIRDVAYFLGSCLDQHGYECYEALLLGDYFAALKQALADCGHDAGGHDWQALEREWRMLYPIAQTDFYRFLAGWMPTHWKINDYSRQVAATVIAGL